MVGDEEVVNVGGGVAVADAAQGVGEDTPETLETTKQPLDFVASLVHVAIVLPRVDSRGQRRHHGCEPQSQGQLACLVTLIRPVHEERGTVVLLTKAIQQLTSFWSVVGRSGGNV